LSTPGTQTTNKIEFIAVLGAGTMGHGIAQVAALAGFRQAHRSRARHGAATHTRRN
jgi:3-hydroxyacyl-CoA dehydrogenase